ncbi:hypothetical protein [Capnocytophaga leadbetteri]
MKKLLLTSAIATLLISCGYNQQEQMLYDYENDGFKELLKADIKDIGFKIKEIKKVGEITANDSMQVQKEKLHNIFYNGGVTYNKDKDTLSFDYVINSNKIIAEAYQKTMLMNIQNDESYLNYDLENKQNKAIEKYVYAEGAKKRYEKYKAMNNAKLADVYQATYTIKNPLLNVEQTITKTYYTNKEGNKFIISENSKE